MMPDDIRHMPFEEDVADLIAHVGRTVLSLRKARRMSRRELSETSGVSPRYLAKLEAGDGNISIGLLKRVALALDTPVEQLLVREDHQGAEIRHLTQMYRRADAGTRARVLQMLDPARTRAQKAERLCLVGLRGAGKSTLGAKLAVTFDAPFIELNDEIERSAGIPVAEIIALYGQEGYRQLEADTLDNIVKKHERAIVAVAGGIVSEETTFQQLLSRFHTVWLRTSPNEHMERVRAQGDVRPMEGNPQAMLQLRQILKAREVYYSQADHLLDTGGKPVEVSQAELSDLIQTYQILGSDRR
ncbi:helix-turn-helix transcriptional regulator [Gymnodinialimonas sp. 57CJ19]|uniref:helix-turn-helix transcriptional regulator n=1 Tax=Gymnodinialimonas sp. 57CJ19 TaxID=3138498 RepID=UPI00313438BE